MERRWLAWSGFLGATAVGLGAFGAHALDPMFEAAADGSLRRGWWETAAHYHLVHAPVVAIAASVARLAPGRRDVSRVAGVSAGLLVAGAVVFAGTLYAMALGAPRVLGAVTPIGGTLLIAGWVAMIVAAARTGRPASR